MQEALQNATAHAHGARTWVRLTFHPLAVELVVEDDGQGFDLAEVGAHADGHLGLAGMRERAANLGGSLVIESALNQGTRVRLQVPAPLGTNEARADEH